MTEDWVLKLPHSTSKSFSVNINGRFSLVRAHVSFPSFHYYKFLLFHCSFLIPNSTIYICFAKKYVYCKIDFWLVSHFPVLVSFHAEPYDLIVLICCHHLQTTLKMTLKRIYMEKNIGEDHHISVPNLIL